MVDFWSRCEGQTANCYRLGKWLDAPGNSATYWTEYGDNSQPAVIKLVEAGPDSGADLETWTALAHLSHPRLVRLLDSGECEIDGVHVIYAVMERSEGNLANVLPERALTVEETREMLEAAVDALAWLHERGLVHGALAPANIVAVGDRIKLASDCITPGGHAAAAEDVRALGATIVHALIQDPEAAIPENLPQPFLDIARNCLRRDAESRWTIADIRAHLERPRPEPSLPPSRARLYTILAAALTFIAVLLLMARSPGPDPAPAAIATPAAIVTPAPQPPPAAAPEPTSQPAAGNWSVVVATYAQRKDAETRARRMASRFPRFKPEVYSPRGENQKPYYLVIIGSSLTQDGAAALQQRARSAGLAHDAYITRFSR